MKRYLTIILVILTCFSYANPIEKEQIAPHVLVLFGATGNLTQHKLVPSLFSLYKNGALPKNFIVVGTGREERSQEAFQKKISPSPFPTDPHELELWQQFLSKFLYYKIDLESNDYDKLNHFLKNIDSQYGTQGNRLFYLATPAQYFPTIIQKLHDHHLVVNPALSKDAWTRVVIEKPFGHDLQSALLLQKQISQCLDPSQIFLIDHYLGKELIQNILTLRFANTLFSHIWNNQAIDHVQITISEDQGIDGRGKFWEETGLLRDIIQNHLMQMLALVAMEPPASFEADAIRDEKVKVIKAIRPFKLENLNNQIVRGQYGPSINENKSRGYRQEEHVDPKSTVETFVASKLFIDNPRWQGVPFYVRAGKGMAKRLAEIVITFKKTFPTHENPSNQLVIRIQPDEEIYWTINSKRPGLEANEEVIKMSFNYKSNYPDRLPNAYEILLFEGMLGRSKLFVRLDEIIASWVLFTPVLKKWRQESSQDLTLYPSGSWGPTTADNLLEANHYWHIE